MSLFNFKFFCAEAKFSLGRARPNMTTSREDLDMYMRIFNKKKNHGLLPSGGRGGACQFFHHGMLEEYDILFREFAFPNFCQVGESASSHQRVFS